MKTISLKPAARPFFRPTKDEAPDESAEKSDRPITSAVRWTDGNRTLLGQRKLRRIAKADTARTTKKHRRQQIADFQQRRAYGEIASVRVLGYLDEGFLLGTGGLRLRLIEDGDLTATKARIVDWVDTVVDGEDAKRPVTVQAPVGHTPKEVLEAAGFSQQAIVELYAYLEGGRPIPAKGPADAALLALGQRIAA